MEKSKQKFSLSPVFSHPKNKKYIIVLNKDLKYFVYLKNELYIGYEIWIQIVNKFNDIMRNFL